MWNLWWTKWHWDRFFAEYFRFPLSIPFHRCSITRKNEKRLIIFITGLHNKPQVCGASVVSAAGPFTKKKASLLCILSPRSGDCKHLGSESPDILNLGIIRRRVMRFDPTKSSPRDRMQVDVMNVRRVRDRARIIRIPHCHQPIRIKRKLRKL